MEDDQLLEVVGDEEQQVAVEEEAVAGQGVEGLVFQEEFLVLVPYHLMLLSQPLRHGYYPQPSWTNF